MIKDTILALIDKMENFSNKIHDWLHGTPFRERIIAGIVIGETWIRVPVLVVMGVALLFSELSGWHILLCIGFIFTMMVESVLRMDLSHDYFQASVA